MSEKNAHQFLLRMRQLRDRMERVENVCSFGMPDTNGCFVGYEFWIETKQPTEPKRAGTPLFGSNHQLELNQRNWFLAQRSAGGAGIIYIQTDKGLRMFIGGGHADEINDLTIEQLLAISFWNNATHPKEPVVARAALINYCMSCRP